MAPTEKIIGREREKEELYRMFDATHNGNGSIVLIAGEAGMGKTLLAEEMLAPPNGLITLIIRDYLARSSNKTIDCGNLTVYLSFLLPELGNRGEQPDADTLNETIVSALQYIIQNRSTSYFLDDLHWADEATPGILPTIVERFRKLPLVILATYRSDEIPSGHHLRRMRNELRRRHLLYEITIEPLNREETATLIERVIDSPIDPSLRDTIYDKTLGVPFVHRRAFRYARNPPTD